jgi:hypothetical protein
MALSHRVPPMPSVIGSLRASAVLWSYNKGSYNTSNRSWHHASFAVWVHLGLLYPKWSSL